MENADRPNRVVLFPVIVMDDARTLEGKLIWPAEVVWLPVIMGIDGFCLSSRFNNNPAAEAAIKNRNYPPFGGMNYLFAYDSDWQNTGCQLLDQDEAQTGKSISTRL